MKAKWSYMPTGVILSLLCFSLVAGTASATVVWSEDFTAGMPNWTTFAFLDWNTGPTVAGNFSVQGGALTVLDNDVNYARHNSTVEVGTWSFDLFVPDAPHAYVGVSFMSNGSRPIELDSRWIAVEATTEGTDRFNLWWQRGANNWVGDVCYTPTGSILGWHHIEITRTSGGQFNIFFNGSLEYTTVTNDVIHSTYLECYAVNATGAAFDNIVVDDQLPTTTTTTTTGASPPWDLIAIGGVVVVIVVLLVVVLFRRR
ncbi:MAG: hypothetical protein ACFFCP_14130 [Promethearchaeota archaeon]